MSKIISPLFQLSLCTLGYLYSTTNSTLAQVTSDGTVNTQVNQNGNVAEITGGQTRGSNLFHSFQDFSVSTGNEAFFNNANDISNIFSRVTGGNISNIDGLIRANDSASLFLINPAGIIFGQNARLDIGGSFLGSTASSILFEDGEFSAADNLDQPILTVNAPIGLDFRDNPGDIINRAKADIPNVVDIKTISELDPFFQGLEVSKGKNIALVGGDINLQGGNIIAPGGIVELGGLKSEGIVQFDSEGILSFPNDVLKSDIKLNNESEVNVRSDGGGFINVNVNNLELTGGSELLAGITENTNLPNAQAGDILINATESVRIIGQPRQAPPDVELLVTERDRATGIRNNVGLSPIKRNDSSNQSTAIGNGGKIQLNTKSFELINSSVLDTNVFGKGNGGDILINSSDSIVFDQGDLMSQIRGFDFEIIKDRGSGDAGEIFINTKSLLMTDQSFILTDVQEGASGNGGDVTINVLDKFIQNEGSFILTHLGPGNFGSAGNIEISAGSYEIAARVFDNPAIAAVPALQSDSSPGSQGDAGNITIDVENDFVLDENLVLAQIQRESTGNAGNINISANNILIDGFALISTNAASGSSGIAGSINLNSKNNITISNGAVVDALTENEFDGGGITVNAQNLNLLSGGKIVTGSESLGDAGDIKLNIQNNLVIDNQNPPSDSLFDEPILQSIEFQTGLFANTFPGSTSNGGNISVTSNSIDLQNEGSILAENSSGEGGNINLKIDDILRLSDGSLISAQAIRDADGGNINIDTNFIIAFPNQNNDIVANAQRGNGGNISINAESLLGIQERTLNDSTNDINASSEFSLDGSVRINTPDINPVQGATELPTNVVEPEQTTAQACNANRETVAQNGLTIKGKGGILPAPDLPLGFQNASINGEFNSASAIPKPIETGQGKIQPARGIRVTESGEVILTTYRTNNSGDRLPESSVNCSRT